MKLATLLIVLLLLLGASCTSQDAGTVGMVSAVAIAAPLAPAAAIYRAVEGPHHHLSYTTVYKLREGEFVISNFSGWFTDKRESYPGKSAWVIDVAKEKREQDGHILLTEANLDRWFFWNRDEKSLQSLPTERPPDGSDYFTQKDSSLTIYSKSSAYELVLKQ